MSKDKDNNEKKEEEEEIKHIVNKKCWVSKLTPIHWCSNRCDIEILDFLFQKSNGERDLNAHNKSGYIRLMIAAYYNHIEFIEWFLKQNSYKMNDSLVGVTEENNNNQQHISDRNKDYSIVTVEVTPFFQPAQTTDDLNGMGTGSAINSGSRTNSLYKQTIDLSEGYNSTGSNNSFSNMAHTCLQRAFFSVKEIQKLRSLIRPSPHCYNELAKTTDRSNYIGEQGDLFDSVSNVDKCDDSSLLEMQYILLFHTDVTKCTITIPNIEHKENDEISQGLRIFDRLMLMMIKNFERLD